MDTYKDIRQLSYRPSGRHRQMPPTARAAQFAPFAALTGFDGQISEQARQTDGRPAVSDEEALLINENLTLLLQAGAPVQVCLTVFVPDCRKPGGTAVTKEGCVRRVDPVTRQLIFTDKTTVSVDDLLRLEIL